MCLFHISLLTDMLHTFLLDLLFFKWIKNKIARYDYSFYQMNQQKLHLLNQAFVALVPKKEDPQSIVDYRPISLIHSFAKILSKLMANRLGPKLHELISINQTVFIMTRCIYDNFVYVQQVIKDLHKKKTPSLFIKLDISKAFDTVNWPYLLSTMASLRFGTR
jgi:hypothetical protein